MTAIAMSSGHSKYCRGAVGIIDEVDEARKVVNQVAECLRLLGVQIETYNDDVSKTQQENLNRIVDWHNDVARPHDLDVSIHFNAHQPTDKPMGTEVWYKTQETLASDLAAVISMAGTLVDRGAKHSDDLFFLNHTAMPAVLLEICFVDSATDCDCYGSYFAEICEAIAETLAGQQDELEDEEPMPPQALFRARGKCSHFGGPGDAGVSGNEGLAFFGSVMDAPQLFLPYQPEGTTGLARRLNPYVHYVACRWNYEATPKTMLAGGKLAYVRSLKTGYGLAAFPADWGPHEDTGRIADLSPQLMDDLGLLTDDEVEVVYPWDGEGG